MEDEDLFDNESLSTDEEEQESESEIDYFPIDGPSDEQVSQRKNHPATTTTTTQLRQVSDKSKKLLNVEKASSNVFSQDDSFQYEVLPPDRIVAYMVECMTEVNEVIKLPLTTVRLLLHHFRWDKEKLMERFYDPDHQEELFRQAHIVNPFKKETNAQARVTSSSTIAFRRTSSAAKPTYSETCAICCSPKSSTDLTGLECGHSFCVDCWRQYLKIKIMDEGIGQTIPCPSKCDILVDDKLVLDLIDEQSVRQKYQHLITNSFVECNRNMRWCPGLNCTNAIKAPYCDLAKVVCTTCKTSFCFQCGQSWHEPIKCKWLRRWLKKCQDDSETSNWISAHTKECPKCHATIEKNGGCNHLICKNQACKYEFCWICLGPWEPHGSSWYNCNRFNEDDARKARDDQERSRAALQRYLHYYKRYHNHQMSLKLESKLVSEVRKRMDSMQQQMSWIEVQFLQQACDALKVCRETLMYTYPFAFYLKRNNRSLIFEQNQADLEHATEELSGYLERDSNETTNLTELKQKVQDKYRYCIHRQKVLLDHVAEGYDDEYWEYNEDV